MNPQPVMNADEMRRAISRIAHEILESSSGGEALAFVGILTRGAPLADRLAAVIHSAERVEIPVGRLDIALYRDDYPARRPEVGHTHIPFDVTDRRVILVDEVVFTGRTVRAAIDALMDLGRPASIQLAALIDRGHRELPIQPDYVGRRVETEVMDHVDCRLVEIDGEDSVRIIARGS